jgi:hypothetical protein
MGLPMGTPMGQAGRRAGAGADKRKREDAALPPEITQVLRTAYDRLGCWRLCHKKSCRRARTCLGDLDECGPDQEEERWSWLRHVLTQAHAGQPLRRAKRDAGRAVRPQMRTIVFDFPGFGERYKMRVRADSLPPRR